MQYTTQAAAERRALAAMLSRLKQAYTHYDLLYNQTEDELEDLHRRYTSATPEFYNDIPAKEYLSALYQQRREDCTKALKKPYFGKLIYSEAVAPQEQQLYIGKKGISDYEKQEDIWIVDWRAPVSQLYYSGNLGKASYSHNGMDETVVDLKLKTTLDIQNGELLGFYDSEVVANDDLLVKYLSQNKDVVLSEIIATIQKDQDSIIRKPLEQQVLVQGVAGSGKTTVALHRIAYLLYTYREKLQSNQVLILAANRLFLNYISSMLPDLEVQGVQQGTLREQLQQALLRYFPKLRIPQRGESDYQNLDIPRELTRFCEEIQQEVFHSAVCAHEVTLLSEESVREQVADLHRMSLERMANLMDARLWNYYKTRMTSFALPLHDALFQQGVTLRQDVLKEMRKIETGLRHFFRNRLKKQKAPELLNRFRAQLGLGPVRPSAYTTDDLCILILLVNFLDDGCSKDEIRHIVVDEGQDLNVLQYLCLKSMYPAASFTIVGDVMQNINRYTINDWQELNDAVFAGKAHDCCLLKSYRNTIEISDFAKAMVEQRTGEPFATEPLVRHGRPVQERYCTGKGKERELLCILEEIKKAGYGLNAVICKDDKGAQNLARRMAQLSELRLMDAGSANLELGSYIVSVADSKGLEFDSVVLWDYDDYDLKESLLDYKLLYVGMTRALHELYVLRG